MRVAILTSGGDCPGMNACISKLIQQCTKNNMDCFVVRRGFVGLIENDVQPAKYVDYENISHLGGSVIKCYRSSYFTTDEGFEKALKTVKANKFDYVVAIGGNGTLRGCQRLANNGVSVMFLPATIDNDLFYTEKSLGFDSALASCTEAIDKIKETMQSADRGAIVEVMGRDCADLANNSAQATDADFVVSQSTPYSYNDLRNAVEKKTNGFLIVVQENILNVFELAKELQNDLDVEVRADILGYLQRGGSPSVFDRMYANKLSAECVAHMANGGNSTAFGIACNEIIKLPLTLADI